MRKDHRPEDKATNRTNPNLAAEGKKALQDGYIATTDGSLAMSGMASTRLALNITCNPFVCVSIRVAVSRVEKRMMKDYPSEDKMTNNTDPNLTAEGKGARRDGNIVMTSDSSAVGVQRVTAEKGTIRTMTTKRREGQETGPNSSWRCGGWPNNSAASSTWMNLSLTAVKRTMRREDLHSTGSGQESVVSWMSSLVTDVSKLLVPALPRPSLAWPS